MPTIKPKTAKKIKFNKKSSITLDGKHKEFLNEFSKDENDKIPELKIERQELKDKLSAGLLSELFITGTAATLINLDGFGHNGYYHSVITQGNQDVSVKVKTYLDNIKMEITPDTNGWILKF